MPAANDPLDPFNNESRSEPLPLPTRRLSRGLVLDSTEKKRLTARTPRELIDKLDDEHGDQTSKYSYPMIIPNTIEKSANIYDDPSLVTPVSFKLSPLDPKSGKVYYQNHIEQSTTWTDPHTPNIDSSLDIRGDTVIPPRNLSSPANYVDPYRGNPSSERFRTNNPASTSQQHVTASLKHPQRVRKPKRRGSFSKIFNVSGLHTSTYTIC
jgi:hypothetical protein